MTDLDTLLPPSSTPLERALVKTCSRFNPPQIVPTLWNADTCPPAVLPYLAWALSVDEWDQGWAIDKKRAVVKDALSVSRTKGTPLAVRRALAAIGQPDAQIMERVDCVHRNGVALRNGKHHRRGLAGWAYYRVILQRPVTIDQAYQIKRLLAATQRNCVHLGAIDFPQSSMRRDGRYLRDGSYTRGAVNTSIT